MGVLSLLYPPSDSPGIAYIGKTAFQGIVVTVFLSLSRVVRFSSAERVAESFLH